MTQAFAENTNNLSVATFGGGCFWCIEAAFQRVEGVVEVLSGFSGGEAHTANYRQVCSGTTGHAEVIQIQFDQAIVSYDLLLEIFFALHDPTTLNRQGADVGSEYRSVIFYHNQQQKQSAEKAIQLASIHFTAAIVTEVAEFKSFTLADEQHQNFYANNQSARYCQIVIVPKLQKLMNNFSTRLK